MKQPRRRRLINVPPPKLKLPKLEGRRSRNKIGRPTKMNAVVLKQIEMICRLEINPTNHHVACRVGIAMKTLYEWMERYEGLREAMEQWRHEGLSDLRKRVREKALEENSLSAMTYLLDRRDPDFNPGKSKDYEAGSGSGYVEEDHNTDPSFL